MTPSFATRLQQALANLDEADHNTGKGMTLQDLAEFVLDSVRGVTTVSRNSLDKARSGEVDLWFQHEQRAKFPFVDPLVPVECKNEATNTSAAQIREFATKIRDSGGSDGLIFTRRGLAGSGLTHAHNALQMALHDRVRILVVTCGDLAGLTRATGLSILLQDRNTELRMNRTYISI